jgi:excisionase family DNA binding protein
MSAAATVRVKGVDVAPRLVRLKGGAAYLGMSPWQLRNLVQRGELPVVKISDGGPWLLDLRDLDAWVERNKTTVLD